MIPAEYIPKGILIYANESVIRKLNKRKCCPDSDWNLRFFSPRAINYARGQPVIFFLGKPNWERGLGFFVRHFAWCRVVIASNLCMMDCEPEEYVKKVLMECVDVLFGFETRSICMSQYTCLFIRFWIHILLGSLIYMKIYNILVYRDGRGAKIRLCIC